MLTMSNINWVAGIIEGEGCFYLHRQDGGFTPRIAITMTDEDVIARLSKYLKGSYSYSNPSDVRDRSRQKTYKVTIYGPRAVGWMMTIYSLMGIRRQSKIKEILTYWRTHGNMANGVRNSKPRSGIHDGRRIGEIRAQL